MKSPYAAEIEPNQTITTTFLVHSKDVREKKSGDPYLSLRLGDKTGELDAKMWDNVAEIMDTFGRDDFVKVKGQLQVFHNRLQFTIHKMSRIEDREVDFADYFPASRRDPDQMLCELRDEIAGLGNVHLRGLLEALFADEQVARRYKAAPAAKHIHHAWLGGLIEHVLSVCKLAHVVAPLYPNIDQDLLITGVILHDLGKIHELSYDRGFGYTSEGQLLGHILIGLRMVGSAIERMPAFPTRLRSLVEHMIASHHGELEFGSPKVPMFPEALLLHLLDNVDAKMESMRGAIEKDPQVDGCWTSYSSALERVVLKKTRFLDPGD